MRANHEQKEIMIGLKKISLKAGQFVTSNRHAAEALNVSTGTIFNYLKILETEQLIERNPGKKFTIISIKNWRILQHPDRKNEQKLNTKQTQTELENTLDSLNTPDTNTPPAPQKGERESLKEKVKIVAQTESLIRYYCKAFNKDPGMKATNGRLRRIKYRLKKYSPDQIRKVIDKAAADDYYSGRKGSIGRPVSFDWIIKHDKNVETLLNLKGKNDTFGLSRYDSFPEIPHR